MTIWPHLNRLGFTPFLGLCVLMVSLAHAQAPEGDKADPRRTTIEQKLRLTGHLLTSPKMKQALASENAEARAQADKAQSLVNQAREALTGNDLDQASAALDQALKSVSAASSLAGKGAGLDLAAYRARYAELLEQVKTYRSALVETRKDGKAAEAAGNAIGKLDSLAAEAKSLAEANKYVEANKALGDAYLHAANVLTSLRAGQTVTLSLKFDTPADEYAYEEKVNLSHEMLVDMLSADGKLNPSTRPAIDKALDDNRKMKVEADKESKAGNHASAIKLLEQSTLRLKRTLQSFGVPIF